MKFKPTTIVLVLAAVLLSGVVYVIQAQPPSQPNASSTAPQKLFAFEESQVKALTVKTQLRSLTFEKNSQGTWQMQEPDQTPASDASIAYLLNLLTTGTSDRTLTSPVAKQEDFGFHQPMATIDVTLNNQATHRLILGGYDFNRSSLYAQVDPSTPPSDDLTILLVSPDFDNAVNRPLAEWKAAQGTEGAGSPSPEPSPNLEPSPNSELSPSPEPSPDAASSPSPPSADGSPNPDTNPVPNATPSP